MTTPEALPQSRVLTGAVAVSHHHQFVPPDSQSRKVYSSEVVNYERGLQHAYDMGWLNDGEENPMLAVRQSSQLQMDVTRSVEGGVMGKCKT